MENISGISSVYAQLFSSCRGSRYATGLFHLSFGVLLLLSESLVTHPPELLLTECLCTADNSFYMYYNLALLNEAQKSECEFALFSVTVLLTDITLVYHFCDPKQHYEITGNIC